MLRVDKAQKRGNNIALAISLILMAVLIIVLLLVT